ncbi:MAG: hypothetical protein Fur0015_06760 [Ignavibacteriales bacterium]
MIDKLLKKIFGLLNLCVPQIKIRTFFYRHIKTALFVGTILVIINHFDELINLDFTKFNIIKIVVTYCVPFMVSIYSSAKSNSGK